MVLESCRAKSAQSRLNIPYAKENSPFSTNRHPLAGFLAESFPKHRNPSCLIPFQKQKAFLESLDERTTKQMLLTVAFQKAGFLPSFFESSAAT
jgi:hypothetical protein